ncbi:MAG: glycerophosphodiester phosphodiesterase [Gemmatimonadaceae bacterium]|nr:glycerophosphodiester phosphodiesterase [Chitinophagaceae bacterium]
MNRKKELVELIFTMMLVIGCHTAKNLSLNLPVFDKEGHRGARGLMPENTIPAMIKAVDLGVTTLEMDAVITADSQVILSHEPFFNHLITTAPDGALIDEKNEKSLNIYKMSYAETQRYDVGLKPHPRFPQQERMKAIKPLMKDVIRTVEEYISKSGKPPVFYNIETKSNPAGDNIFHPAPERFVEILMDQITRAGILERTIIQSFDPRTLKVVHARFPKVRTALLIEDFDKRPIEKQIEELGFVPTIYSPAHSLVTETLISYCHKANMKIIPWTVNDSARIAILKSMGVDGIISDYPNLLQNL